MKTYIERVKKKKTKKHQAKFKNKQMKEVAIDTCFNEGKDITNWDKRRKIWEKRKGNKDDWPQEW